MADLSEYIDISRNNYSLIKMSLDLLLKDTKQKLAKVEKKANEYFKIGLQKEVELDEAKKVVKQKEFELQEHKNMVKKHTSEQLQYKNFYFSMLEELNIIPHGKVIYGDITQTKHVTLKIQNKGNEAIIDWNNFDINKYSSIEFINENPNSKIINNIRSEGQSYLEGYVSSDGSLELITHNPLSITGGLNTKGASIRIGTEVESAQPNISETDGSTIASGEINNKTPLDEVL